MVIQAVGKYVLIHRVKKTEEQEKKLIINNKPPAFQYFAKTDFRGLSGKEVFLNENRLIEIPDCENVFFIDEDYIYGFKED